MDPVTLGLISSVPSLLQSILGIGQDAKGNAYGNVQRPTMNVPPAILQSLALARSRASSPILPGAGLMTNELQGNAATNANRILQAGGSDVGANIANLDLNTQKGLRDIQAEGIKHQDAAMGDYDKALNTVGGYQQKAWDFNFKDPYELAMHAANALQQTGQKNIFEGIKGIGQSSILAGLFPNKNNPLNATVADYQGAGAKNLIEQQSGASDVGNQVDYWANLWGGNGQDPSQPGMGLAPIDYGSYGW